MKRDLSSCEIRTSRVYPAPVSAHLRLLISFDSPDKHGRRPSDPDYDPTTLLIPKQQFDALTDAKKQYYGFKREMFDTSTIPLPNNFLVDRSTEFTPILF